MGGAWMSSKTKSGLDQAGLAKPQTTGKRARTLAQKLRMLDSPRQGDPQEQKDTFECLRKALGPDLQSKQTL
jgi:hypothetical protein